MSSEVSQPVFQIQTVYLKDMSLEQPHSPAIFLEKKMPELEVSRMSVSNPWRKPLLNRL